MDQHREEKFLWPSPQPRSTDWMMELSNALHSDAPSGNMFNFDSNENTYNGKSFEANLIKTILDNPHPDTNDGRYVYAKLRKNPSLRKSLASFIQPGRTCMVLVLLGSKVGTKKASTYLRACGQTQSDENSDLA